METKNLLTDSEAAEVLRLTPRQVLRLANRGELPSIAFPNREVRFDRADLSRFIESHKRPATEVAQ
jgi:excisionase family DNA binding protein